MAKLLNLKILFSISTTERYKMYDSDVREALHQILKFIARSVSEYAHMVKMFLLLEELLLQLWNALLSCTWCTNLLFLYC